MFPLQKLYKKDDVKFNAEYFQTLMGQLHAHVINTQIQSLVSFSYSRPTFMGRWLAALKAHKGLPLIFYLLHQCGSTKIEKVITGLQLLLEKQQQQQQFMNYNCTFCMA